MTLTRKIVLAVAGLLGLLLIAAAWLVLNFDANRYRGVAIDWMRQHHERTLSIGDVRLGLLPRLQVELRQVELSEFRQPAQRFVALESARLAVRLLPLLQGRLVVDEVGASGLSLRYSRDAQGRRNIDDLLQPATPPAAEVAASGAAGSGQAGAPLQFEVSAIRLERLLLQLDDAQGHLRGEIELAALRTGSLSAQQLTPVELELQARLSEPALQAQLKGDLQLQFDPGDGAARPLRLALRQVALRLGLQMGALQLRDSRLELAQFELVPDAQQLALSQLALRLQGALAGGAEPFEFELDWPQLAVQGTQLQGAALAGRFALQGPAALQGTLSSGAPSGSFAAIQLPALRLALGAATAGASASRINGVLQTDLQLQTASRQLTLDKLLLDATVQNPALKPLQLKAQGRLQMAPPQSQWQLDGTLNAQAFHSDGQLRSGAGRPQLQASARFGELDLDALLPPRPAAAPASAPASAPGGPAPDVPIDLAALRSLDARVSLQAGALRYQPYVLRDLHAEAVLADGRLQLAPLRLRLWDGRVDARLSADAGSTPAQQRLALQATAQDILIEALLQDLLRQDPLAGRGQLQLELQSGGASLQALKAALNGTAALQLRDGAVKGINLAQKLREVKAALRLGQDSSARAVTTEQTDFSELSASFQIRDGVADNRDLSMKSPFLRLSGAGQVDLPGSRLDVTARTTLANTTKGQGGADVVGGLTVPVRLHGPFAAPQWRIVWSEVALGDAGNTLKQAGQALKARAGDQLKARAAEQLGLPASAASAPLREQVRDKAREALQDRLKGLFGR